MLSTIARRLLPVALAAAVAACTGQAPEPTAAPSPSVDASAVNAALADVSGARRTAAAAVDEELRTAVRIAPMAQALRSPSSIDATLDEEVPVVTQLVAQLDPAATERVLTDLGGRIVIAETAIDRTASEIEPGSWQDDFLQAQRELLDALAAWNTASAAVNGLVADALPLWQDVAGEAAVLDENRWRYRSAEEAAATWEIEAGDDVEAATLVAADVDAAIAARDEAAAAVTAADERAAEVFAARPAGQ